MKRIIILAALALILSGCDIFAPQQSAAISNKEILEQAKITNQLLERNNKLLDSLVTITAQKGK
jgi:PBP1b-binding outer membrane lipoprotein LpoB